MKTKISIILAALLGVAAVDTAKRAFSLPKIGVTVSVFDEQDVPISGARVKFVFGKANDANAIVKVDGLTDGSGKFFGEGHTGGSFGASVEKDGYYSSGISIPRLAEVDQGRSQMVGAQAILRLKVNPIPLYVKNSWIEVPEVNKPCGYDLKKGDWVAPYGSGIKADFILVLDRHYTNRDDFETTTTLSFSERNDGIQKANLPEKWRLSSFRWPREAPDSGYDQTMLFRIARSQKKGTEETAKDTQGYFFRVRTAEDNGKIVSALYGKISEGIRLAPSNSKTCLLHLKYYLNPTPLDRNIEWDTTQNLLSGLSFEQTPRDP